MVRTANRRVGDRHIESAGSRAAGDLDARVAVVDLEVIQGGRLSASGGLADVPRPRIRPRYC